MVAGKGRTEPDLHCDVTSTDVSPDGKLEEGPGNGTNQAVMRAGVGISWEST
jgi:hypothetical protein